MKVFLIAEIKQSNPQLTNYLFKKNCNWNCLNNKYLNNGVHAVENGSATPPLLHIKSFTVTLITGWLFCN